MEQLTGVSVLPRPCSLSAGGGKTPVHTHVGSTHSRFFWAHYHQGVQEAARHLQPRDQVLWMASWRSAGAKWMGVFGSGLVPDTAQAKFRNFICYRRRGGPPWMCFSNTCSGLGDSAWKLRNHRLEQLLRTPRSAAARLRWWFRAAGGNSPSPPPRPIRDFVASLRLVNGTLELPAQEDPHLYQDFPGGFWKHLRGALFLL